MIDENEIIQANKTFPKEIFINGSSLLILHYAIINYKNRCKDRDLLQFIENLHDPQSKTEKAKDHFYIKISRCADPAPDKKQTKEETPKVDSYSIRLCNILAQLPKISSILSFQPNLDFFQLFKTLNSISSQFLINDTLRQSNVAFFFAMKIIKNQEQIVKNITNIAESKSIIWKNQQPEHQNFSDRKIN
jgi:hypothetical protein